LNFKTLSLKLGHGETIVEIKKFTYFWKNGHISNQVTDKSAKHR